MKQITKPLLCRICTKPLLPSEVIDHIQAHGWLQRRATEDGDGA